MFNEICQLGKLIETTDDYGNLVETIEWTDTFCKMESITQSEFYQAQSVGMQPEVKLITRLENYDYQTRALWNGNEYTIDRNFVKGKSTIELTLTRAIK